MAIEIVDFPIKNGDFPLLCKRLPEGIPKFLTCYNQIPIIAVYLLTDPHWYVTIH